VNALIVSRALHWTKGGSKLHNVVGRGVGLPRTLRLPLLDKSKVVGVVDALKCVNLHSAEGFSRIGAVSENQLPGLGRKIGRNLHVCDDIDRLRAVLRKRGAEVSKQTGHDHNCRNKT
jgi:hypothetical protein